MRIRLFIFAVLAALAAVVTMFGTRIPNLPPAAVAPLSVVLAVLAALVLLNIILHAIPKGFARAVELLLTAAILLIVIGGIAYVQFVFKPGMIKGFIASMPKPVATVMATRAEAQSWAPKLQAIGTFRASEGIDIAPQLSGWVVARHFDSGDRIKAGQLLLEIDTSTEQADLKNGAAQLRNAEVGLDRQKTLLSSSNTSKSSFDSALAARDTAAAVVERYRAIIAQKMLKAPFSGRLGIRKVDVGQYVSPGMSLVTLQKLSPIYVDFSLPEQNLKILRVGQTVDVTVDAYPGETFSGKVQSIDARVNQDTRNILVRAIFENDDERLLPGMFANVAVGAGAPREVVTVPRTAVTYSLYGDSVFVVRPEDQPGDSAAAAKPADKKPAAAAGGEAAGAAKAPKGPTMIAERRFVRVGEARADAVEIAQGVAPGDVVVTGGQIKLQPNAHVTIDPKAVLKPAAVRPRA